MKAMSLPFRIDGYGRVASTSDPSKMWADRVRAVLMTSLGERIMRPMFGSTLTDEVYDIMDEVPELTFSAVSQAFADFLPRLDFNDVIVVEESEEEGIVSLEITYTLPDLLQDPVTQTVNIRID
jgi:phage baseplate assembly protein W